MKRWQAGFKHRLHQAGFVLLWSVSILLAAVVMPGASTMALTSDQLKALQEGAQYFDPAETTCGTSSAASSPTGTLPSNILGAIDTLKPIYEQAANATGVPWQLLAAVHYREANNNPNQDLQAGNPIGGPWGQSAGYPYGHPTSLEQSAEMAAKQLIAKSAGGVVKKPINQPNPDPAAIQDTLFSYNGRAAVYAQQAATLGFSPITQPYEGSPYVMNNYDSVHQNMKIITKDFGGLDGVDTRLGAFTVYALLGGGSSSSGSACITSVNAPSPKAAAIVQKALEYAWSDGRKTLTMKPTYAAAIQKAIAAGEYVGGIQYKGIDCGGFVTRVMRDSGADPKYNAYQGPTASQEKYMDDHPELYQRLGPQTSTANLEPGDIAINSEHTYIFVGNQKGFAGNAAASSLDEYAPTANVTFWSNSAGPFIWYRLKA